MIKKILLIGGGGFIGHNLATFLKNKKYSIYIIDNFEVNNFKYLKSLKNKNKNFLYKKFLFERVDILKRNRIKIIRVDAKDKNRIQNNINKINPDIIIHLAAVSHDSRSNSNPDSAYRNSFGTLFNTLEAIKHKNKIHLIFLSSSMVYGTFKKKIITETEQCNPIGVYGSLKLAAELLIKAYANVFSIQYTIVRPSALYGERCISNRVVQVFLENAFEKKEIKINGDGKEKLDFTYIEDLCQGILKIIKNKKKSVNQIFNLTFGNSKSILYLKKLITKKFKNQRFINIKRNKLIALRGTLSVKKAQELLSYKPKYNFKRGFEKYYLWYKNIYETS